MKEIEENQFRNKVTVLSFCTVLLELILMIACAPVIYILLKNHFRIPTGLIVLIFSFLYCMYDFYLEAFEKLFSAAVGHYCRRKRITYGIYIT